jgi:hypothetical protein
MSKNVSVVLYCTALHWELSLGGFVPTFLSLCYECGSVETRELCSGVWLHVVRYIFTNVAEDPSASIFTVGDGGNRFIQIVGKYLQNYAASLPRKQPSS